MFRRYVALILDGLRVRRDGPSHLPVAALTRPELEAVRLIDQR
jgi:hypothetical protein